MLRFALVVFGGVLVGLTGCRLLTAQRDPNEPLPPNWDISQEQPAPRKLAVPVSTSPVVPDFRQINPAATTNSATADYKETWIGLNHWAVAHGIAPPERLSLPPLALAITNGYPWQGFNLKARLSLVPLPAFLLHTTNGVLMLQPESRLAYWDDVEIHLGYTPELVQGEMLVHVQDLHHTNEPLLQQRPMLPATNRMIVIDPDLDEDDAAVPDDLRGKNFALDWAERLVPLLATNGWTVCVTHTNTTMLLAEGAAYADMQHPDLFLHLCFGLPETGRLHAGLATYCLAPANLPADGSQPYAEENWHAFPNNAFDAENLEYAFCLQHVLNDVPGVDDRGVHRSRAMVILRDRNCPAICVTGGSLADPHDAVLIASPWFRQELAEAITSALQ